MMVSSTVWIIIASAIVTFATRIGGHLVLSRMKRIPPRVEAALNAVPAAVLTTLVAPALIHAGPAELAALAVSAFIAWRGGLTSMFLVGAATVIGLRAMGL
jgi:uncharacterized membrane protein